MFLFCTGDQIERASSLASLSEELTSLERHLGIWTDLTVLTSVGGSEPEAKRPRIVLQDPCVSSTERNSASPYRASSTEFYEVSDDVIVISESQGWEEKGKTLVREGNGEDEEGKCMTVAMATEMLDQEGKKEVVEMMGEDEKEEDEREEREECEEREEREEREECCGSEEREDDRRYVVETVGVDFVSVLTSN